VIGVYDSFADASKKLCITQQTVRRAAHNKKRQYSPALKMEVAIRMSSK
jgi:hypothetical protein